MKNKKKIYCEYPSTQPIYAYAAQCNTIKQSIFNIKHGDLLDEWIYVTLNVYGYSERDMLKISLRCCNVECWKERQTVVLCLLVQQEAMSSYQNAIPPKITWWKNWNFRKSEIILTIATVALIWMGNDRL